ncbi:MAG: sigma-70 family RNA polymerase sigma factor [Planctomycetia bacterium]|nr:sigma-70 family RNA polymerase sigma factor [Planctomycetia bacterium]
MTESTCTRKIEELIPRLLTQKQPARAELIELVYDRLHAKAQLLLRGYPGVRRYEQTTEVLHEALAKVLSAELPAQFTSAKHIIDWCGRIITNHLIDQLRHYYGPEGMGANLVNIAPREDSAGQLDFAIDAVDSAGDPVRLTEYREWFAKLQALPEDERRLMYLLFYEEKSVQEVAEILGVDRATVWRWKKKAMDKLSLPPWAR